MFLLEPNLRPRQEFPYDAKISFFFFPLGRVASSIECDPLYLAEILEEWHHGLGVGCVITTIQKKS